jgi:hypothetical protein
MTRVRGIYSTRRTATERENLRMWARDSLVMREGALRCGGTRKARCALWFTRAGCRERGYTINPIVYLVLLESNYG